MRRQLAFVVFAATAMVVIAFVLPLGYLLGRVAEDRAINAATAHARLVGPVVNGQGLAAIREAVASSVAEAGTPMSVVLADGRVLGSTRPVDRRALAAARRGAAFVRRSGGGAVVYQPSVGTSGATAIVVVHVSAAMLRRGVLGAWAILGLLGVVLAAGAVFVADRIARSATRPLTDVARAALRLAAGDGDARAPGSGPVEVQSVAHALNLLADRVDSLRRDDREHLADLSHQLRTPMTALQLEIGLLPDAEDRNRLGGALERLDAAVTGMITSARAGPGETEPDTRVDLTQVVERRMAFWSVAAAGQARTITVVIPSEPVWVVRGPLPFEPAIDAVVANALRYSPPTASLGVSLTVVGRSATLTIDDAGPGFSTTAMVERGVRGDDHRDGTGLGLDIARRTARLANGTLRLGVAPLGGGQVAFQLPVVESGHPGHRSKDLGAT